MIIFVAIIIFITIKDFINLSVVITITQEKFLKIFKIKEICNKFNLCYYCKKQHSSKIVKNCFNKTLAQLRLTNLDDTLNNDKDIFIIKKLYFLNKVAFKNLYIYFYIF